MTSLGAFRQTISGVPFDAYLWAAVFVVSATLFYFLVEKLRAKQDAVYPDESSPSNAALIAIAQRLNIEVLEGYIGWEPNNNGPLFGTPYAWLLLKVRVAPNMEPAVRIKSWAVRSLKPNSEYWYDATSISIPAGLGCAPKALYDHGNGPSWSVGSSLIDKTYGSSISFGSHEEGFILCQLFEDTICHPFAYSFEVKAVDSLNNESVVFQYPGEWLRPSVFAVTVPPPPMPLGIMAPHFE